MLDCRVQSPLCRCLHLLQHLATNCEIEACRFVIQTLYLHKLVNMSKLCQPVWGPEMVWRPHSTTEHLNGLEAEHTYLLTVGGCLGND